MTPLSPTLSKLPLIFCGSPFSSLVTNCSSTVSSIQSLSFTRPPLLSTLVPGDGNSSVDQQPQSQRQRGRQKSCAEKDPRHDTAAVPLQHSEVAPDQQHLDHEHPHYHQQRLHVNAHAAHARGAPRAGADPVGGDTRLCTHPSAHAPTYPSATRGRTSLPHPYARTRSSSRRPR